MRKQIQFVVNLNYVNKINMLILKFFTNGNVNPLVDSNLLEQQPHDRSLIFAAMHFLYCMIIKKYKLEFLEKLLLVK